MGAGAFVLAPSAFGETIVVFVYDMEFSTNMPGDPIVDPVIQVGDTIQWQFISPMMPHTTTSVAGIPEAWNSGVKFQNDTFEHTFTNVGTWEYYCALHGFDNGNGTATGMSGVVTVVPEPATFAALGLGGLALLRRRRPG